MIKNNEFLCFKTLKVETVQIGSISTLSDWSLLSSDTDIFPAFRHKCKLLFREMGNHLQMERGLFLTEQENCLIKARGWTPAHSQQMKETNATQLTEGGPAGIKAAAFARSGFGCPRQLPEQAA